MNSSIAAQKVEVTTGFLDSIGVKLAKANEAFELLRIAEEKIKKRDIEIERKEAVIVSQMEKKNACLSMLEGRDAFIQSQANEIVSKDKIISRSKPKKWAITATAGYGMGFVQKPMMQPVIAIGLSRVIFSF